MRWGLINRVVSAKEVLPTALALGQDLARQPRQALAQTKALLRASGRGGLYGMLENERWAVMEAADQPDFAQRAAAFVKRG